jgi:hypothetical protein
MEATVEEIGRAGERGTASENDALHDTLAQSELSYHSNEQVNTWYLPFAYSYRTFFASLAHFAKPRVRRVLRRLRPRPVLHDSSYPSHALAPLS